MDDSRRLIRRETLLAVIADSSGGRMARMDRIMDAMSIDPAILEGLSPSELYFLMKDIGPQDAAPMLVGATDEQLSRLVDFDAWEGHSFAPERFTAWLDLAAGESDEVAIRMLRAADPEALALQFIKQARIIEVDKTPEQVDVYGGRDEVFQTPDNAFWVISEIGADAVPDLKKLVEMLYAEDIVWARDLLKASAWELVASLEDEALRFRTSRLGEEGFPSPEEAQQIYKMVDMVRLKALMAEHGDRLRAPRTAAQTRALWDLGGARGFNGSLLTRALASMRAGPRKTSIVRSLAHLLGEVVMAETRGDFGDSEAAARAPARLHGFVSAGLEHLGSAEEKDAADLLERLHPRILFRVGYTLLLGIRGRARDCLRNAGAAQGFRLLDEVPWGSALEAAAAFVPQLHSALDHPGGTSQREIQGLADVRRLRTLVSDAAVRLKFVTETLGAAPATLAEWIAEDGRGHVTCTTLVATALLGALVDLPPVTPLTPDQLVTALDLWMPWDEAAGKRVTEEILRDTLGKRLGTESPAVQQLLADAEEQIRSNFEELTPGTPPDIRVLGSVVLVGAS